MIFFNIHKIYPLNRNFLTRQLFKNHSPIIEVAGCQFYSALILRMKNHSFQSTDYDQPLMETVFRSPTCLRT